MKKKIIGLIVLIITGCFIAVVVGYNLHLTSITTSSHSTTPPVGTPPITMPPTGSTTPPSNPPPTSTPTTITYDFSTGEPTLLTGQSTPLTQTSGGVIATFSSPMDPAAFSIQSYDTTFYTLSQFSGNYLWDDKPFRVELDMKFSKELTAITLTFATVEQYAASEMDQPSTIELTAYMETSKTTLVGSATAHGTFSTGSFPQGILSYTTSSQPFNQAKVTIPFQTHAATQFFVDNVKVTLAP